MNNKIYLFLIIALLTVQTQAKVASCNKTKVFEGRFFGIAKQMALFRSVNNDYRAYEIKKIDIYHEYNSRINRICKKHKELLYEANRQSANYPKITQGSFYSLHRKKMDGVIKRHVDLTGNYNDAIISLVKTLKSMNFPHYIEETPENIFLRFSKTIEAQIIEELRQEQINKIENVLFGKFEHMNYLHQINHEVQKIQGFIKTSEIKSGNYFQEMVEKYRLKDFIKTTKQSSLSSANDIDEQTISEFVSIASDNLKKSMYLYVNFVKNAKNAKEKIERLKLKPVTPVNEILKLLYQSRLNGEHSSLYFLNLNFYERPIYNLNMLNNFPSSYSYIKLNCPKLYQAMMLKLEEIKDNLLKLPYFSTVKVSWKEASYSSLYQKALESVKSELFNSKRDDFYSKIRL